MLGLIGGNDYSDGSDLLNNCNKLQNDYIQLKKKMEKIDNNIESQNHFQIYSKKKQPTGDIKFINQSVQPNNFKKKKLNLQNVENDFYLNRYRNLKQTEKNSQLKELRNENIEYKLYIEKLKNLMSPKKEKIDNEILGNSKDDFKEIIYSIQLLNDHNNYLEE